MKREQIYNKYNGKCAYSGTPLESDWEIDHINSQFHYEIGVIQGNKDDDKNKVPVQKAINHYKRALYFEDFRDRMKTLHLRIAKLPKKPRTEKGKKKKQYLLKVASYFGITEDRPFSGIFYFENH